jgi:prevent-host-death family protein
MPDEPVVNIHEAKTHLSRLVERAARGESFIIARAGKPLVKVTAVDVPRAPRRLGFLAGQIQVPDDFDEMGADEIAAEFGGAR